MKQIKGIFRIKGFSRVLFLTLTIMIGAFPQKSDAMTIGYYDTSRELWGFDGNSYLSNAKQWLVNQGHTLVTTSNVDSSFLSGVDAFYTGLIKSVDNSEVLAMQNFVDKQGGFLFIQTDWASASWTAPANTILSNWGISHGGDYSNDSGHYTVGSSDWVTSPNIVTNFIGGAHSVITSAPDSFEVLAKDSADRTIMGVFDAGAGRSSDVLVATDINFWDDDYGWANASNRKLWENIWKSADKQTGGNDDGGGTAVPEPATMLLFGSGLLGFITKRKKLKIA